MHFHSLLFFLPALAAASQNALPVGRFPQRRWANTTTTSFSEPITTAPSTTPSTIPSTIPSTTEDSITSTTDELPTITPDPSSVTAATTETVEGVTDNTLLTTTDDEGHQTVVPVLFGDSCLIFCEDIGPSGSDGAIILWGVGPDPGNWILPPLGLEPAPAGIVINNGKPTPVESNPDDPDETPTDDPETTKEPTSTEDSTTSETATSTTTSSSGCPTPPPSCSDELKCGGDLSQKCSVEGVEDCDCVVVADGVILGGSEPVFSSDDASESALASSIFSMLASNSIFEDVADYTSMISEPASTPASETPTSGPSTRTSTSAISTSSTTGETTTEEATSETPTDTFTTPTGSSSTVPPTTTGSASTTTVPSTTVVSTPSPTETGPPLCVPYQNPHEDLSYCTCSSDDVHVTLPIRTGEDNICGYTTFTAPPTTTAPVTTQEPYTYTDDHNNVIACSSWYLSKVWSTASVTRCNEPSTTLTTGEPERTGDPVKCEYIGSNFADADCFLGICGDTRHDSYNLLGLPDSEETLWEDDETDPVQEDGPREFGEGEIGIQEALTYIWDGDQDCRCELDGEEIEGEIKEYVDGDDGFTYWSDEVICRCEFDCHPT